MRLLKHLEWIARKIASEDAAYPVRRASYSLRRSWVDRRFPTRRQKRHARFEFSYSDVGDSGLKDYFRGCLGARWHFDLCEIGEIVARIPAQTINRAVARAEEIVNHRFAVLGQAPIKLDPLDWNYSPNGEMAWTRDLNRHACFEILGFAYRYTSDERFAQAFVELSNSWMDQMERKIGRLEWDTPFQLARRINSWVWSVFLFLGSRSWRESEQRRFLSMLGVLTEYLHQTVEYHSPGNHILLEAKTLALCGEVFPEFEGAGRWRAMAWRILGDEIEAQVCDDGVHAERSTMYHRIISGELAELWLFCSRNDIPQRLGLERVVRRMAEFQRWIDLGAGRYPLFGDSLDEDTYYRFSAPVIVAAESGTRLPLEGSLADHTWWVQRRGGSITGGSEPVGARAFPEGGYYVSRSRTGGGMNVLVWDCGPLGYDANRKHAHADALSVVLSVEGEPLLVDPGQGRDLRKTRAHNTISVDGEDQAIMADRNEIWNPPTPEVMLWDSSEAHDVMGGRHDGYRRLPEPVVHERLIVASRQGYWLILDRLTGSGVHTAELRYHVASRAVLEGAGPRRFRIRKDSAELVLTFFGPRLKDSQPLFEREERIEDLHAAHSTLIPVLCGRYTGQVPFVLGTFLTVSDERWEARLMELNSSRCMIEVANGTEMNEIKVKFAAEDVRFGVEIARFDGEGNLIAPGTFEPKPNAPLVDP